MAELSRKKVNAEVERIVMKHESTFRDCPSEMTVALVLRDIVRELQAHMDATVEAAYAWGVDDMKAAALEVGRG